MDVLNRLISRTNSISSGKFERLPAFKLNDEQKQQKNVKIGKLSWKCCKNNLAVNSGAGSNKNFKIKENHKTKNSVINASFSEPNLNIQVLNNNEPENKLQKQNLDYEEDCGISFDGDRERLCDKNEKDKKECSSPKNLKNDKLPQLSPIAGALQLVRDKFPGSKKTPIQAQNPSIEPSHNVIVATASAPSSLVKQLRKQVHNAKITDVVGGSIKKYDKSSNLTNCVDFTIDNSIDKNKPNVKNKNRKNNSIDGQRLLMFEEGMAMD